MIINLILAGALAALVSLVACRMLIGAGPVDAASARRHAHKAPTPTSGGLGIALGFGAALMAVSLGPSGLRIDVSSAGTRLLVLTSVFSYGLLMLGFWDDAHPLSARLKFLIFGGLSFTSAWALSPASAFPIGDAVVVLPFWLALLGSALWVFTLVNTVNFMDGANGLAMGSMAIGLTVLAILALSYGEGSAAGAVISVSAVGALLGFLYWNFPRGRLFAGDAGALYVGGLGALGSLVVIHRTGLSPVVPALVFFPLLADALMTLAWRMWRRRSLLDGHSEHLYQIAIHAGMSHAEVALLYWAAMLGSGAIAIAVARDPGVAPWAALAALAGLAVVVSLVVRRFADRRGIEGV